MIARDEARCIARCLRSAAPFVDEMLVVDTGSTDDTRAIAAACGARVAHFGWCDDFAAARNFALSLTDAPWRLVLDADEWIQSGGEILRELTHEGVEPFVGRIRIQEVEDGNGEARLPPLWVSRLLPRGLRFAGRIHEQIEHRLAARRVALTVGHDGYQRAQRALKADRNERLLEAALAESAHSAYLHYQLGREHENRERFAPAVDHYDAARRLSGWPPPDASPAAALQARHPWLHDLVVRRMYCMKRLHRFAPALEQCRTESGYWAHSPDFHFALGDLMLDYALAEPQRAGELLPQIEACWLRCLEIGETPELEGAIEGRGGRLAAHNLAAMHESLGNRETAQAYRRLAGAQR